MSVLFLILFLFCITACYTDLETGKVKNKDLLIYLFLGLAFFGIMTFRGFESNDQNTIAYVTQTMINFLVAFAVSFMMRSIGIWPAGDAKTFALVNLLLPLTCYNQVYFTYFPGFTLLLNIFFAGLGYIIIKSVRDFVRSLFAVSFPHEVQRLLGHTLVQVKTSWPSYISAFSSYMVVFVAMSLIANTFQQKAGHLIKVEPEIFYIFLFFAMRSISGYVNKILRGIDHVLFYILSYVAFLFLSGWSFDSANSNVLAMLVTAIKFMLFYGVITKIADYYINNSQILKIHIGQLKEGDLPTKMLIDTLSPEVREELKVPAEGLSHDNLEAIMNDLASRGIDHEICIYQPIPFVPIIFAGVLITIITGISFVQHIKLVFF